MTAKAKMKNIRFRNFQVTHSQLRFAPVLLALFLAACGAKTNEANSGAQTQPPGSVGKELSKEASKGSAQPSDGKSAASKASAAKAKPALTVNVEAPKTVDLSNGLNANGVVAAWQEASIGADVGGLRLTDVLVNVGDVVKKGQVLAVLSQSSVQIEMATQKAQIAESEAMLADARANAERARQLDKTGAISAQQIEQFLTAEKTAVARLDAARTRLRADELRLNHTRILASDSGIISARAATLGAVVNPGQELFRLIRQSRLEWRGEVTTSELSQIKVGQAVTVDAPDLSQVQGKVRMISPTVDAQTRNGMIFVDLPAGSSLKSGMLVKGLFELGKSAAATVPQSALLRRDGFSYVYVLDGVDRVKLTKVETGMRAGDRIAISQGLPNGAKVVASGVSFLNDGDLVRVQEAVKK